MLPRVSFIYREQIVTNDHALRVMRLMAAAMRSTETPTMAEFEH